MHNYMDAGRNVTHAEHTWSMFYAGDKIKILFIIQPDSVRTT